MSHGRVLLHALHWGFLGGPVDHDRLADAARSLDFDAERFARIFEDRTHAAGQPVEIRTHLGGRAALLDAHAAVAAGIATAVSDATIHPGAGHWWPDVVKAG